MSSYQIKVYFASKLAHAEKWRDLVYVEDGWGEIIEMVARWPHVVALVPDDLEFIKHAWTQNQEDIARADVVVLYALPGENLRGALVEAGMALALGKPVILVGENSDYGTWRNHSGVHSVPDLDKARQLLTIMRLRP